MNYPFVTLTGNVAAAPEIRPAAGVGVTDFRVGVTPRRQERDTGEWTDGETMWFKVTAWRTLAQHCVASLKKGDKVVVTGKLSQRSWTTEDGQQRVSLEVDATSVGLDISRRPAVSLRNEAKPERDEVVPRQAEASDSGGTEIDDPVDDALLDELEREVALK